jgi:TPR repeat protein
LCCLFCLSSRADFESGLKAYNAGDYAAALREWQPLADQGAPHAQYNMGLLYARGEGVGRDFAKAADYYRKAADQGIVEAEYNLGVLYSNGQGVPKDDAEASKWFLKAAQQGDAKAANSLGSIYDEGPGGFQNFTEAEKWYRKAAESGIAMAQFNLGVMYDIGHGVKQDFAEAVKWYRKAAEQGNAAALCNIAILYYNGQGVPVDRVQANKYFLLAKERGEPRAADLIQLTTEKLSPKQIAEARSGADAWNGEHPVAGSREPAPVVVAKTEPPVLPAASPNPTPLSNQAVWTDVARIVAVGDIHGDYDQLVAVLRSAGLIDQSMNWIGGKTHLVQTGNILDRGGRSREVMDLFMKLQKQAPAAGGYVHCLLGNHEVMNLYGDLRYVSPADYGVFRAPDSDQLRDREFENFRRAAGSDVHVDKEEWDKQHPLGYFEQRAAFGPDGVYGKWLRSLNAEIRINDTLFVHSGISRKYCSTSIDEVNRRVREELSDPSKLPGGIVTDQEGPFWYRGLAQGDEKDLMVVVDATLENSDAKREAFGHTYAAASITPRFNGKVILLDTGLPGESGSVSSIGCLLIDEGKLYALNRDHPPSPLATGIQAADHVAQ